MIWLLLLLLQLFRPATPTPPVPVLCAHLETSTGTTCTQVADWLDELGRVRAADRLRREISNGF